MPDHDPESMPTPRPIIDQISTNWLSVGNPAKFVMAYGPAIRNYLLACLGNEDDAEEVSQDLLLQVTRKGFATVCPERGRFRDYLKVVVRNTARGWLRRKRRTCGGSEMIERLPEGEVPAMEQTWLAEWRECILTRTLRQLERHQRSVKGNIYYTVLRTTMDHPEEDCKQRADRVTATTGQALSPDAFRKQLSRARRLFADLLVAEIEQTLEQPTTDKVQEELAEVGLLEYLRDYLDEEEG